MQTFPSFLWPALLVSALQSTSTRASILGLALLGFATAAHGATVPAGFSAATTVPVTAASYDATGNEVALSLAFAPPTGTTLTVVKNTGLAFIEGKFSNLAQGQAVNMTYHSVTYRFVANYYGGSGNDLVLHWAGQAVTAWGNGGSGQLGNGDSSNRYEPVAVTRSGVLAGKTVVSVVGGESHSLALCADGTLAAWGSNQYGQLGNGSGNTSHMPVAVTKTGVLAGKTVVTIAASDGYNLALCSDGTLAAWGSNYYGQLGDGTTTQSNVPVAVTQTGVLAGKAVVSVAAGYFHSLALCADGSLAAWGYNGYGQLGDGSTSNSSVPIFVTQTGVLNGKTVVAMTAGAYHSLALCADGTLAAWGRNYEGQLGNGSNSNSHVPVAVNQSDILADKTVVAVVAGAQHSLALCADGTLAAWGRNDYGPLGNGNSNISYGPVAVTQTGLLAGKIVVAAAAGGYYSLALCSDGTLTSWGNNDNSQLGNGSNSNSHVPVAVTQTGTLNGKTAVAIAAGYSHSLALVAGSHVSTLSGFTLSAGSLSPAFTSETTTYSASVVFSVTPSVTITPTATEPAATIQVNGSTVVSGTASASIPLAEGANPITVLVTAPDGSTQSTYTITVNRVPDAFDADGDGLGAYLEEVTYGTNPALADTDRDGLSDGWEVGAGRFSVVAGNFTWQQARTNARGRGGDLASFPDENRWNRAMESLGGNALDDYTGLWIGASDAAADGTWTWVNGQPFSFQPWGTGRPSNTPGNTLDYAEVSGGSGAEIGKWYDRSPAAIRDGYLLESGYATDPKVADVDGDGLTDSQEQTATTNPSIADTDGDGLNDGQEVNLTHTNPKLPDTDGDGTNDDADDEDGDTLSNLAEITQHKTDPLKADTDSDGLSDSAELNHPASHFALVSGSFTYAQAAADAAAKRGRVASFPNAADCTRMANKARLTTQGYLWLGLSDAVTEGTWLWTSGSTATYQQWLAAEPSGGASENHAVLMENSTKWADTTEAFTAAGYLFERVGLDPLVADTDADGLTDGAEVNTTHSSPVLEDTDADGLSDGAEVNTHGSSPLLTDTDSDGLSDRTEVEIHHSNPALKDSDGDGFDDLFEVNTGFNPASATSTPDAASSIRTAVEFRFNAAAGVSYRIEGSTDLENWTTVETDITGAGAVVTRFYSTEGIPKRYFRVRRN